MPVPFPLEATIAELQDAMDAGRLTSLELVNFYLARIAAYDSTGPALNAFILVNPAARDEAAALDAERASSGARGPLHGIPVAVKDNLDTADMPTTAGSLALKGFTPSRDAVVVRRLRDAGAVIIGKTNLYEFAAGWQTVSSLGGQTRSPYDPTRDPGGSSGGTAVAVTANFAAAGLGTDTCGSVRYPAAHNNLYGLRPTRGLVSTTGVIPLAPALDAVGPLARSVDDLAILLEASAGEPADPDSMPVPNQYRRAVDPNGLAARRIGFCTADLDPEIAHLTDAAIDAITAHGAEVVQVVLPSGDAGFALFEEFALAVDHYLETRSAAPVRTLREIAALEVSVPALQAEFPETLAITTLDSEGYRAAVDGRAAFRDAVVAVMDVGNLDAIAYPAARSAANLIGAGERQKPFQCITAAYAGLPAMSMPIGFDPRGLPVGLELMGRPLAEPTLIALAAGFEAHTDHRRLPPTTPPR
jgi:amidase